MPRMNILSAAEQTEIEKPPVFNSVERTRFFDCPASLLQMANKMRKPTNRVGFLLMCGYFRATRRFFSLKNGHQRDIKYICRSLSLDPEYIDLTNYTDRDRQRHHKPILGHYGFQTFSKSTEGLLQSEVSDMMNSHLKPRLIFGRCLDFLVKNRIALPTSARLTEIIRSELTLKKQALASRIDALLSSETRQILNDLLTTRENTSRYRLTLLRKLSQSTKPRKVKASVADFHVLSELYAEISHVLNTLELDLQGVRYYAGSVLKSEIFQLKRRSDTDRYLHLIAFITHQYYRLNDTLVDVFLTSVQSFQNTVNREHKNQVFEHKKVQDERVASLLDVLDTSIFGVIHKIRDLAHHDELSDAQKVQQIQGVLIDKHEERFDKLKADFQQNKADAQYYQILENRSLRLQNRVSLILRALNFEAAVRHTALDLAILHFKEKDGVVSRTAAVDFLESGERKAVLGDGNSFRVSLYKVFLFLHVRNAIKAGNLNFILSYKYRPLDDYMIDKARWMKDKDKLIDRAGLSEFTNPEAVLKKLGEALHLQYEVTNLHAQSGENHHLKIMSDGKFTISTPAQEEVESEPLRSSFPQKHYVPLAEILSTVDQHCNLFDEFQHWQQTHNRPISRKSVLLAGVMALGCGIGIEKMAQISPDITERELEHAITWRFSLDNIIAANDRVVKAMDQMELPNFYRKSQGMLHTASDGQKFEVRGESLNANHSFKYFGNGQGVSAYTFIDERNIMWHSLMFSAAERESAYVIDGLMHNDVIKSDIHSTDTHGYSEAIFGVTHLLGFSYAPRIKNLKKQALYQVRSQKSKDAVECPISPDKYVNEAVATESWDDILRLVTTIKLKETTASDIFRRLNSYSRQHSLYKAIKAFGQIIKTIFILRYIDDLELRQSIEKQLNKVELANKFTRAIAVGNPREYTQVEKEEQEIAEACNRLIKNCIVCWNYLYLTQKLRRADSQDARDQLLKTISTHSPIAWEHINMLGEYDFSDETLRDSMNILLLKRDLNFARHLGGARIAQTQTN